MLVVIASQSVRPELSTRPFQAESMFSSFNATAVWVWYLTDDEIATAAGKHRAIELLSAEETTRYTCLRVEADRDRFLAARIIARAMLSAYTGGRPERWTFRAGEYGRPEIVEPAHWSRLGLSITHTDGLVACAVAPRRDVGVDAEAADHHTDYMELADRFFSREEVQALRAMPGTARRRLFLDYWTLKESYLKARGCGIAIPLDQFWFDLHRSPATIHFSSAIEDDASQWRFSVSHPSQRHAMALAVKCGRRSNVETKITHLTADKLLFV